MTTKTESKYDTSKINDDWRPSCPFCHAPWTDQMISLEVDQGGSCPTCGPDPASASLKIHCNECHRLIYQKDYDPWL